MRTARTSSLPILLLLVWNFASAQWTTNLSVNTKVCQIAGDQKYPEICSDGAGGAIIVWQDGRGASPRVYAQRLDSGGVARWTDNGVLISSAENSQLPKIVSDGAGGAIITWFDMRSGWPNSTIAAQRVNASGDTLWQANGVIVASAANSWSYPDIDGYGRDGAVIAWIGPNAEILAQKLDTSGHMQWTSGGVPLGPDGGGPQIVTDGSGGAIVSWFSYGGDPRTTHVFAQRVSAAGATLWLATGDTICFAKGYQHTPDLVSDGSGGAIIGWLDGRADTANYVYAQRTGGSGWATDGIKVAASSGYNRMNIASDKAGGAIIAWHGGTHTDIYVQRVSGNGSLLWGGDIRLTFDANPNIPSIFADGGGGAYVLWETYGGVGIGAQHVRSNGTLSFAVGGTLVCTGGNGQGRPKLTTDGNGTAIVVWEDMRPVYTFDIYAQRFIVPGFTTDVDVSAVGELPRALTLGQNFPNPFNPSTQIAYTVPRDMPVTVRVYDLLGKEVATLVEGHVSAGARVVTWNATAVPSGVYFCRMTAEGTSMTRRLLLLR